MSENGQEEVKAVAAVEPPVGLPAMTADEKKVSGVQEASGTVDEKKGDKSDKPDVLPSFFIGKDEKVKIEVDVLTERKTGKIAWIAKATNGLDFSQFDHTVHSRLFFEFTMPNYEDMSSYRQRSAVYRREAGATIVDRYQLRNFFLIWHLKDWNLPDNTGKKVELKMDAEGTLADESMRVVYSLPTSLLDVVLTLLEKEVTP